MRQYYSDYFTEERHRLFFSTLTCALFFSFGLTLSVITDVAGNIVDTLCHTSSFKRPPFMLQMNYSSILLLSCVLVVTAL
jgi:hypothetical protein